MSPRWGFGAGWVALAIDMPPLWGFWVFGLDMLCDIHCAPLERRDWKDRRSIDISLLWSERHISACWGYGSGKIPDLQQGNHKGCPYKDRPNVLEGSSFYRHIAPLERKIHVASRGLWVGQDTHLQQGNHKGCPYKDRPNILEGSSFYRHIAPLERKTHVASPGLWVEQDARPTAGQPQGLPLQRPTQCRAGFLVRRNGTQICVPYELNPLDR